MNHSEKAPVYIVTVKILREYSILRMLTGDNESMLKSSPNE